MSNRRVYPQDQSWQQTGNQPGVPSQNVYNAPFQNQQQEYPQQQVNAPTFEQQQEQQGGYPQPSTNYPPPDQPPSNVQNVPNPGAHPSYQVKHKRVYPVQQQVQPPQPTATMPSQGYVPAPQNVAPSNVQQGVNQVTAGMQQMNMGTQPQAPQQSYQPITTSSLQCPPKFMRMTTNVVGNTTQLIKKSGIPLGCIIKPMATPTTEEEEIPVVNFGFSGIVRCRRCRSYINPFVIFVDGGRRWKCNLCGLTNDCPGDYVSPLDASGRRSDIDSRPELSKGLVEFVAPAEYMVRPPQPTSYFFVIDVSYTSITSGMFQTTIQAIKNILDEFPGDSRTRFGLMTFDKSLHFYNLKSSISQPRMLVVSDIDDVFLPLAKDLLVNLNDSKEIITMLLDKLPNMFQTTSIVDSCLGVAVKAAAEVVKTVGGKILVFSSVLPSIGKGKLKNREDLKLLGTDKEVKLLSPEDNYFKDFALDISRLQISVDLFLFSSQYVDIATLGCMPQFTGGHLSYYPGFKVQKDASKFMEDLKRVVTRETGWEAVMRVRTSKALKVSNHYGNFFIRSTDLLALPNVDADKSFGIQLDLNENTIHDKFVSIQAALLYTTSSGERRIRCLTQCIPVTSSIADIFRYADVEAVATLTTKMAIDKSLTMRLADTREALVGKCIDILCEYRKSVATGTTSQLILPQALQRLPLLILGLIKSVLFCPGTDIRPDERTYHMMLLRTLGIPETILFLHPRLFALHQLSDQIGTRSEDNTVELPPVLSLSSQKIERNGAYLIDNGQDFFLWISKQIDPYWLHQVFGLNSLEGIDTSTLELPNYDTDLSQRVNNIINFLRYSNSGQYQKIHVIKEGDPGEAKLFSSFFIEDRIKSIHSYHEFLANLHKRIIANIQK